jgi:SAM-dependent methyltransferase
MSTNREIFNQIAPGWYGFRHRTIFRAELEDLARRWRQGRLLNVGCGHGPDFSPFINGFELYGADYSIEMLKLARKYAGKHNFKPELAEADACYLPYPDGTFDWAMAVATYHHLESREARLRALKELHRVLRPGSEVFVTVWNRWQRRFWLRGSDTTVPWHTGGRTLHRYYHLFTYGELESLVKQAGFEVIRSFPERSHRFPVKLFSRNICLLLRK